MQNNINQYLPTYKEDFKNDPRWIVRESQHYNFHYFSNSVAENDIDELVNIQEESFKKIIVTLNVEEPKEKINYYFYPDKQTRKELMGDDGYAQAIYKDFTIHVLYTKDDKPIGEHEDTHLLSLPLGLATGFFAEGLAEFLSWERIVMGKKKSEWLKEGKNKILPIKKIVTQKDWMDTPDEYFMYYYSFAGLFVKKLIENYGIEKFKQFYRNIDRKMSFDQINIIFKEYFDKDIISFNKSI